METKQVTFESGATREALPLRYDLCSPMAIECLIADQIPDHAEALLLFLIETVGNEELLATLTDFVQQELLARDNFTKSEEITFQALRTSFRMAIFYILEAYARAMHEGAEKYGERNWESGMPEDNLRNHAINHLVKMMAGDTSEAHLDHLIWNVMTIIHFRELEKQEKQ